MAENFKECDNMFQSTLDRRSNMVYLSMVLFQVVAPILIMLVIGAILQLKFRFNLKALSNLITYCLMPAAVFINIYETQVNAKVLSSIIVYLLIFSICLMMISWLFSKSVSYTHLTLPTKRIV